MREVSNPMKKTLAVMAAALLGVAVAAGPTSAAFADEQHGTTSSTSEQSRDSHDQSGRDQIASESSTATSTPTNVDQVGIYLYEKVDPSGGATWENSGLQTLCGVTDGTDWFTSLPCALPSQVCGTDWAFQQDKVTFPSTVDFQYPRTIQYPDGSGFGNYLTGSMHGDLSTIIDVPDCVTTPPQPPAETGSNVVYAVDCDMTLTTTSTPWTQDYVLDNNTWVLGTRVDGTPVVESHVATADELASLGLTVPASCIPPQPQSLTGSDPSYSVTCDLALTTSMTPWTQDYVLVNNSWVPGDRVTGAPTTETHTATAAELTSLGIAVPAECPVTPPVVEPPTVTPPVVTTTTETTTPVIDAPTTTTQTTTDAGSPNTGELASTGLPDGLGTIGGIAGGAIALGGVLLGAAVIRRRRNLQH